MGVSKPDLSWRQLCRTGSEASSSGECSWLACGPVTGDLCAGLRKIPPWLALDVDNSPRAVPRSEVDHDSKLSLDWPYSRPATARVCVSLAGNGYKGLLQQKARTTTGCRGVGICGNEDTHRSSCGLVRRATHGD